MFLWWTRRWKTPLLSCGLLHRRRPVRLTGAGKLSLWGPPAYSVRDGMHKVIWNSGSGGSFEAYDLSSDPRYAGIAIPATESLKDTIARVLPYWESTIVPELNAGKTVLISAHGNSLRALVKHLSGISDEDITGLEIPTGQPIVYDLDASLRGERYYLSER